MKHCLIALRSRTVFLAKLDISRRPSEKKMIACRVSREQHQEESSECSRRVDRLFRRKVMMAISGVKLSVDLSAIKDMKSISFAMF